MADQRSRLTMDILARVRGTGDVDRLAKSVDNTGDEMSEAARDAQRLDRAIDEVSDEIAKLNRELLKTGDIDVFEKTKSARSTLQVLRRMRREMGDTEDSASRLGRTIGDALGSLPSQLKGGLIIGLVGAGAVAAPLIAGAVAAAVVGSVGAGGIVGGVAAASRDSRVKAAASAMVDQIDTEFDRLGESFEAPVIQALDILGDAASGILRDLRPELQALAPVVVDLAHGIAGFAQQAAPGLAVALRESVPILQAIAAELPGLGHDIGQVFAILSQGGEDAQDALVATINLLGGMAQAAAFTIRIFTALFGLLKDSADIPILGEPAKAVAGLLGIADGAGKANLKTQELAGAFGDDLNPTLAGATGNLEQSTEAAVHTADSLRGAAEAAGGLSEALRILNGEALASREAERQFQEAIDAANEALKENGATLDINTEAGRENQEQLDRIAVSTGEWANAIFEQTGSQRQAIEVMKQGRKQLIDTAIDMGATKKEAKALADEILGIPEDWYTEFTNNAGDAAKSVFELANAQDRIDKFVQITYKIHQEGGLPGPSGEVLRQHGGPVFGPPGIDKVRARLTAGEFVIRKDVAQKNMGLLHFLNSGQTTGVQTRKQTGPAPGSDGAAMFEGTLVLDSGEFLGKVRGEMRRTLSEHDRHVKRRVMSGSGRAR